MRIGTNRGCAIDNREIRDIIAPPEQDGKYPGRIIGAQIRGHAQQAFLTPIVQTPNDNGEGFTEKQLRSSRLIISPEGYVVLADNIERTSARSMILRVINETPELKSFVAEALQAK